MIDGKEFKLRLWHLCTPCHMPSRPNMPVDPQGGQVASYEV
jgi:hypothetical protein